MIEDALENILLEISANICWIVVRVINVRNYQEFIREQGAPDENTVIFPEQLIGVMPTISILDEETMVTMEASGFYFDYGKIVFIAPR